MKKYIFSALMMFALNAGAQVAQITFDTNDYKAISAYDNADNSPLRKGLIKGNAAVADNPDTSVDPTMGSAPDATAKAVALQRSRFGSNTYGVRIDLNEPFRMTKTNQYIHVMAYLKDKPTASKMMVIGLGKRTEDSWSWQDGTDEQFWATTTSNVNASNTWQDVVCSFKGFSYSKAEKVDSGIDIYSLVIIPDVSSPAYDATDWVAYFDEIVVDGSAEKRFSTEKYATSFDKSTAVTRTDRYVTGVGLTVTGGKLQSISGLNKYIYNNRTSDAVFSAMAGDKATPKITYTGSWMSGYAYCDWNVNGVFDTDELLGSTGTNNSIQNGFSTAFTVPAATEPGFYRMRYKVDWNNTDAKGAEALVSNGGGVTDVILDIHEADVSISQNQLNGDICLSDGVTKISNYTHTYGTSLKVKIVPEKGFVQNGFTIRYGYDVDAESQFDGNDNPNYIEVAIPATEIAADSTYTIPGDYLRGKEVLLMGDMQQVYEYSLTIAGVPDGEGSVTYGGKTYKNGETIISTQFFSADDVTVNDVEGYVCKSKELKGSTLTVTYAEVKTGENITSLDDLSNKKAYFIHSSNNEGYLCYNSDVTTTYVSLRGVTNFYTGTKGSTHYADDVDPFNTDNSWQILQDAGKYYLYNVGQKKFVTRSGRNYLFTNDMTAIDGIRDNGDGTFSIHAGGGMSDGSTNFACICNNETEIAIRNWTYNDHGATMYITENPNIEVTDIFDSFVSVTYHYYYDGELRLSETIKTKKGNFYPEPTALPAYTSYTLPSDNVNEDVEKDITVTASTPFVAAKSFDDITSWYTIAIKTSYYWSVGTDGKTINLSTTKSDSDDAKWAFVGNPFDGYYLYNAANEQRALTSAIDVSSNTGGSTYPFVQPLADKTTAQVNHWTISKSSYATNGFFIAQDGYPSSVMNLRDGKLAYWTGGADAGSTVTIEEAETPTAIASIKNGASKLNGSKVYNLAGQRIDARKAKGIVIYDGKKSIK